ncbi:FtsX-like permease family protein [Leptobacterium flavescens]|uniref:FtsX-like permease family protein n=1 Tax=Leptobacterium flavescens TaxID=472055 RepID=A0A6P0UIF8_9FLAO|nr:ABC transporter permease [Leptobacterium flavescens]NER13034.1 FtsX-like permease family protein [Leptobacterium flavescens]
MIKNYFKIAWRNLIKNKFFSFINIFGLAVGLATCFLLMLYVFNETTYDKHHTDVNRIYRIALEVNGEKWAAGPAPLSQGLMSDMAEVEETTRLLNFPTTDKFLLKNTKTDRKFYETNGYYVDSTFFRIFSYDFKYGDKNTALSQPNTMVISDAVAQKMFGEEDPVDKLITIEIPYGSFDYTVKGVFKQAGNKSHIDANFFLSMRNDDLGQWVDGQTNWNNNNIFYTYVKLKEGSDPLAFEQKLPAFLEKNASADFQAVNISKELFIQPLKDIYLKSNIGNEISSSGGTTYLYIFGSIAAFLLLIACINFMNLSTASSEKRAREVGVQKVMGARKRSLIFQYLGESMIIAFLALLLAILLIYLLLPVFNAFAQKELDFLQYPVLIFWMIGLTMLTGLISGLYPAFYLSSFKITTVIKGALTNNFSAKFIRKGLVVFQFATSVCLILMTVIMVRQLDFIENRDLGFKKEQQMILQLRNPEVVDNYSAFKNEVLKNPSITSVSAGSTYPGFDLVQDMFFYSEGKSMEDKVLVYFAQVYEDYIETLGYELLYGRPLSPNPDADQDAIVLNETAVKQFGYEPENAVGKKIYYENGEERLYSEIVGVIRDFNFKSLHQTISPYALTKFSGGQPSYFILNIKEDDFENAVADINTVWKNVNPETPLQYSFLDQDFQMNYEKEQRTSDIIISFTLIAIFIACLGLLGLASFTTEQRRKEVGIRRVLGSSVLEITSLLSKDFIKLVLIAVAVAGPVSWYLGNRWLQDFAYRVDISWWLFAGTALVALIIALATISFQVIKASIANPVKSLRTE